MGGVRERGVADDLVSCGERVHNELRRLGRVLVPPLTVPCPVVAGFSAHSTHALAGSTTGAVHTCAAVSNPTAAWAAARRRWSSQPRATRTGRIGRGSTTSPSPQRRPERTCFPSRWVPFRHVVPSTGQRRSLRAPPLLDDGGRTRLPNHRSSLHPAPTHTPLGFTPNKLAEPGPATIFNAPPPPLPQQPFGGEILHYLAAAYQHTGVDRVGPNAVTGRGGQPWRCTTPDNRNGQLEVSGSTEVDKVARRRHPVAVPWFLSAIAYRLANPVSRGAHVPFRDLAYSWTDSGHAAAVEGTTTGADRRNCPASPTKDRVRPLSLSQP